MPTKKLLVDAIHPEETRIVVTSGNKLEEFDFESASRRQLRGNIYLAKVTRVEPSLQAAFVEYGGNRHGFLAFSEIHPDYYQIPVADREALLADQAREAKDDDDDVDKSAAAAAAAAASLDDDSDDDDSSDDGAGHIEDVSEGEDSVDDVGGGEDALEEVPEQKRAQPRKYKIQEVIKRRQVMLVQVVKEERGNKGAALTTYLSLAGRYSVLMPNTARGGGISRKITNSADRKRLKEIAGELDVPQGMGVILRTAGASRTKAEVKRDFEHLLRLWENVRSLTLKSQAPCLVYEEGSLIKRTIRDLYSKDINEVWVAGETAYREAKDFMRLIMPSHAKNVQLYREDQPIFYKHNVESQLDSMFSPQVTLPSGGYLVINPTEALVSIDVNSGRATKEHNIEDTALQTNLEAAEEVARQLRLRDLAGLVVIDFIDMMEKRANKAVERKLKDALKNDRARIQVGRISHFGLLEMSRQRIRFGVVESSTHVCPVCNGTGVVRSTESVALMVMRAIEDHVLRKPGQSINVRVPFEVALYLLNIKRISLNELEAKYKVTITITADRELMGSHFHIERGETRALPTGDATSRHVSVDSAEMDDLVVEEEDDEEEIVSGSDDDNSGSRNKRRRRRRGGRNRRQDGAQQSDNDASDSDEDEDNDEAVISGRPDNEAGDDETPRRRRRRGRRGGRRNRRQNIDADNVENAENAETAEAGENNSPEPEQAAAEAVSESVAEAAPAPTEAVSEPAHTSDGDAKEAVEGTPKKRTRSRAKKKVEAAPEEAATEASAPDGTSEQIAEKPKKPRRTRRKKTEEPAEAAAEASAQPTKSEPVTAEAEPAAVKPDAPKAKADAPKAEKADAPAESSEEPSSSSSRPERRKKDLPPEGVVVTSSNGNGEEESTTDDKPKKAGWWQRNFFGS